LMSCSACRASSTPNYCLPNAHALWMFLCSCFYWLSTTAGHSL
jgi:hypothetical protein